MALPGLAAEWVKFLVQGLERLGAFQGRGRRTLPGNLFEDALGVRRRLPGGDTQKDFETWRKAALPSHRWNESLGCKAVGSPYKQKRKNGVCVIVKSKM